MDLNTAQLWILTGARGTGKTTFCRHLAHHASSSGWDVAGLISPAWLDDDGKKIGILAEDLRSGEQRVLAYTTHHHGADLRLGPWHFDERVLDWGNQVIADSTPCDLLIVDELGPLEFKVGNGLTATFDVLSEGRYRISCVVIRPSLLAEACARWPRAKQLPITEASIQNFLLPT